MASQAGMGLSKIIILLGAGYTSSIMMKNGGLSDVLCDLQSLVKRLEKSGDSSNTNSDALASQVRQLAMEIRQLSSLRQVTVLNGDSNVSKTALALPAATLWVLGYGYMWWKGLSFSDLMYVTKHSMANAVSSMTKHLEQVSSVLDVAKRHLTQRIQNLDRKLDEQNKLSQDIKNQVTVVCDDLSQISCNLDSLHEVVSGLDETVHSLEYKQDLTNGGVSYLCNFFDTRGERKDNSLQGIPSSRPRGFHALAEAPSLMGLQQIADIIGSGNTDSSITNGLLRTAAQRSLTRATSMIC